MTKFGGFLARKTGLYDKPPEAAPASEPAPAITALPDNPLELDEELFSALGAQLGGDNESLRNLLLDANAKIGELDNIKAAVAKLADPVSKTLRAFEAEKSEKISLQTVLNNTRTAYGKLRNEVAELEKEGRRLPTKNARRCARSSPPRRACCARPKPPRPRSPSMSPPAAPRSSTWRPVSRRRPAKARRCARRFAASANGWSSPTSAPFSSKPTLTMRGKSWCSRRTKSAPCNHRSTSRPPMARGCRGG